MGSFFPQVLACWPHVAHRGRGSGEAACQGARGLLQPVEQERFGCQCEGLRAMLSHCSLTETPVPDVRAAAAGLACPDHVFMCHNTGDGRDRGADV